MQTTPRCVDTRVFRRIPDGSGRTVESPVCRGDDVPSVVVTFPHPDSDPATRWWEVDYDGDACHASA